MTEEEEKNREAPENVESVESIGEEEESTEEEWRRRLGPRLAQEYRVSLERVGVPRGNALP